jgi:hypothetical protein
MHATDGDDQRRGSGHGDTVGILDRGHADVHLGSGIGLCK